jgi:hypothetical protein
LKDVLPCVVPLGSPLEFHQLAGKGPARLLLDRSTLSAVNASACQAAGSAPVRLLVARRSTWPPNAVPLPHCAGRVPTQGGGQ